MRLNSILIWTGSVHRYFFLWAGLVICVLGCTADTESEPVYLDKAAMMDPATCGECHQTHLTQWSGSMHAYASTDPVFLAMNARGQRETNGELGDFCVQCHAPMAVRLGLTHDGLNLAELPEYVQGIGCFFCHTAEAVEGAHNAPITLADNLIMKGSYKDPVANSAHLSGYSKLMDRERIESASMCGSCHDIVTPKGVHLERTFAEWQNSLFSHEEPDEQQTCGNCHMAGKDDVAADYDGVFLRRTHNHMMVGVDVAITDFPETKNQLKQVKRELNKTVTSQICVTQDQQTDENVITVSLENLAAGHSWPSGATQDRRAWVELIAYDADGQVLFESGVVKDDEALTDLEDPNLWRFGDKTYNEAGEEVHMFWEAASYTSELLPAPTAHSVLDPKYIDIHRERAFRYVGAAPERVMLRVRIRPMGLDLLRDLVESGDLDEAHLDSMPTFNLGFSMVQWKAETGISCEPEEH